MRKRIPFVLAGATLAWMFDAPAFAAGPGLALELARHFRDLRQSNPATGSAGLP